jgi:hypothetical protein
MLSFPARREHSLFKAQSNYLIFIMTSALVLLTEPKHLKPCPRVKVYFLSDSDLYLRPIGELFSASRNGGGSLFPAMTVYW